MSEPQAPTLPHHKRIFARLGVGATIVIVLVLATVGIAVSVILYQTTQQPNIQATAINIPPATYNPQSSTVLNKGPVTGSASFDYTPTLPGEFELVFVNNISQYSPKTVSLNYTEASTSGSKLFVVNPESSQTLYFALSAGDRLHGNFAIITGQGYSLFFYITGQTCTQTITYSFTLINRGSANGYGTVQFTADQTVYWHNRYFVAEGQQLPESGSVALSDCVPHTYNVLVTQTQKA